MRVLVLLLFSFFSLLAFSQPVKESQVKHIYYISSSMGSDANDGLSEEKPLRSIRAVKEKSFVKVRLKAGDVFFEHVAGFRYTIFESYGEGEKPMLCGFKVLKNVNAWQLDGQNGCWVLDLTKEENFVGYLQRDNEPNSMFNDVGCIYDAPRDKVYGHLVKDKSLLMSDGDFYTNSHYQTDSVKVHPFGKLYFKTNVDPRQMGHLCFSMGQHGVTRAEGCVLRNIAVVGFARHGVANAWNATVEDCQFDLIGGAIQVGYQYWVRYGNGIEFGGNTHDNLVTGCLISRTYDCGVTIQGKTTEKLQPTRIHFVNNRFYHCRQAFEHFISSSGDYESKYTDCSFSDNLCYMMGENEFSTPQARDANILSYENAPRTLTITDNYFFGAPYLCGYNYGDGTDDNVVYVYESQYLNHYHGKWDKPTILAEGKRDVRAYRERTGDKSRIVILKKDSSKARRLEKKVLKKIGWSAPFTGVIRDMFE